MALAFVWFSTHFGGGFSSGRQPVSFFLNQHWIGIFMPALAMLATALTLYFGWRIGARYGVYDYHSWAQKAYYPYEKFFSPLHGLIVNVTMVVATAVAFATSGATLEKMIGTSYIANTLVTGIVIFLFTIFGAQLVRRFSTVVSLFMIACILIAYVPNVIKYFPNIIENFNSWKAVSSAPDSELTVWGAIWWALKYGGLQGCALGAYIVHAEACPEKKNLVKAASFGFLLNAGILYLATFGILAFADQGSLADQVPTLFVVQNGIGSDFMPTLLSITLILAALTTGVNFVFGVSKRALTFMSRNMNEEQSKKNEFKHSVIASASMLILCWGVAQFGLIPLVAKGFGAIGWMALGIITVPVLLRGFGLWTASAKNKG